MWNECNRKESLENNMRSYCRELPMLGWRNFVLKGKQFLFFVTIYFEALFKQDSTLIGQLIISCDFTLEGVKVRVVPWLVLNNNIKVVSVCAAGKGKRRGVQTL